MAPEPRLPRLVGGQHRGGSAQTRTGKENMAGQALENMRFLGGQMIVLQFDLAMCPGQLKYARHGVKLVVLIGEGEGFLACVGHRPW